MQTALRKKAFPGEPEGTQPGPAASAALLAGLLLPGETRHGALVAA
jgi:hypothetical protein